jgi:hypothetical protein
MSTSLQYGYERKQPQVRLQGVAAYSFRILEEQIVYENNTHDSAPFCREMNKPEAVGFLKERSKSKGSRIVQPGNASRGNHGTN